MNVINLNIMRTSKYFTSVIGNHDTQEPFNRKLKLSSLRSQLRQQDSLILILHTQNAYYTAPIFNSHYNLYKRTAFP